MKKIVGGLALLVLVAGVLWQVQGRSATAKEGSFALLQVANMTCGSCVGTITETANGLPGVASTEVNLTLGTAKVAYDPQKISPEAIASAVSGAGFPARVRQTLTAEELAGNEAADRKLAERYVGKINDRLVAKDEFASLVQLRSAGGAAAPGPVWQDLVQRELMLQDAAKAAVVVQPGEVDREIEKMRDGRADFDQLVVTHYGNAEAFRLAVQETMIINRHLETGVLAGVEQPAARRAAMQTWQQGLKDQADVRVFDPSLMAAGGSGCACCNS